MAEAAGVFIAAELAEHTLEASILGGYALAQPTLPLKASLHRIATTSSSSSLQRTGHSLCIIDENAYIFGGTTADGKLTSNDVHCINIPRAPSKEVAVPKAKEQGWEYKCVPAIGKVEGSVPAARTEHCAVVLKKSIYVFGGRSSGQDGKEALEEKGRVWVFDSETSKWSSIDTKSETYPTSYLATAGIYAHHLIIYGGTNNSSTKEPTNDLWKFDIVQETWTRLPPLIMPSAQTSLSSTSSLPPSMTIAHSTLYLITGSSTLSSELHTLDLSSPSPTWTTHSFPSNSLTPGPQPRTGAGLAHVSLGQGREYLVYFFGSRAPVSETQEPKSQTQTHWSDIWAYQLASSPTTSASLKDSIRSKLGATTHEGEWAEVKIEAHEEGGARDSEGKSHPGPRAGFAFDSVETATGGYGVQTGVKAGSVVFWGGRDAKGEVVGDGWVMELTL